MIQIQQKGVVPKTANQTELSCVHVLFSLTIEFVKNILEKQESASFVALQFNL